MIEELELPLNAGQMVTREQLWYAAPGFYRIKTRDRTIRKTGETIYGTVEVQWGQRYDCDRVHAAHVMKMEASRDLIGWTGVNVTSREDGYKIVDGWCRADRLGVEAKR